MAELDAWTDSSLRRFRVRAGLTQVRLATLAGLSVRTLRDMENGRVARPHPRSIDRLADALGLSGAERAELVSGEDAQPDAPALSVWILGPLEVRRAGRPVHLASLPQARLLALLATRAREVVSIGEIAD